MLDCLCRGLDELGHDVLLVATGDSTCPVERFAPHERGLGTIRTTTVCEMAQAAAGYDRAVEWGADIIHDHTLAGPTLGAATQGIPVVTTNHGPFEGHLATVLRRVALRVPLIAISHAQAATAVDTNIAAVIHHGLDLRRYHFGAEGGDYALFLGRMSRDKGVHLAIDVARAAGIPIQIAAKMAEQPEKAYFERHVRPRLGNDAVFIGEAGPVEKARLLAGARCLLNPIQWDEPFGLVAIEALASGTPVVTTPRGAMPELVDDGVTGFVRANIDGLAHAVANIDAIDRVKCRQAAEERFSMERMTADHVDLYHRIVEASG
jgi:glycosyltransferase involved in cell wall biosynthesis